MVQKEVGERLAAGPGSAAYGIPSVLAQLACDVRIHRTVARTVFHPVPNVDSVLVRLHRRPGRGAVEPQVSELVHRAFAHRRKALAGSLALAPEAPADVRARARSALAAFAPTEEGQEEGENNEGGESAATRARDAIGAPAAPGALLDAPWARSASVAAEPAARAEQTEDSFVNLSDWLREDEVAKNTRMIVDVEEPVDQDQVDFAEMLALFKQGVAANVDDADHESHYDLGVAYKEMGLLDEAIAEFQKALRGTEHRVRTYEALGQCFVEKQQYQIALTILARALNDRGYSDDVLVGVLYLLGYASEALQQWPDALGFYERVIAVDIHFRDIGERLAAVQQKTR
jgi:tetratricopeptide (TPR) repeat protein